MPIRSAPTSVLISHEHPPMAPARAAAAWASSIILHAGLLAASVWLVSDPARSPEDSGRMQVALIETNARTPPEVRSTASPEAQAPRPTERPVRTVRATRKLATRPVATVTARPAPKSREVSASRTVDRAHPPEVAPRLQRGRVVGDAEVETVVRRETARHVTSPESIRRARPPAGGAGVRLETGRRKPDAVSHVPQGRLRAVEPAESVVNAPSPSGSPVIRTESVVQTVDARPEPITGPAREPVSRNVEVHRGGSAAGTTSGISTRPRTGPTTRTVPETARRVRRAPPVTIPAPEPLRMSRTVERWSPVVAPQPDEVPGKVVERVEFGTREVPVPRRRPDRVVDRTDSPVASVPAPRVVTRARGATELDFGWLAEAMYRRIAGLKRYPYEARLNQWEGKVVVSAVIRDDGELEAVSLKQSSGHRTLDDEAMELVRRVCPVPLRQPLGRPEVTMYIPITYTLEH